tara:strand:+ start:13767 stop:14540 length:774 start_codon:yes stop_codon:yes gene_type:complete
MSETPLLHQEHQGVLTLTFNRPEKYNALTFEMLEELRELLVRFREEDELRVMLITAKGKYYSAGMDISAGLAPETESGIEFRRWYRTAIHQIFDEIEAIEKPIVSAIQGPCLGGALEMALSCDFRLAAASAKFGLPETNIGALPGSGGTSRLTRLVGAAEAKWLIMAAQTISAERALRTGLVHEIYPNESFQEDCQTFARHLTSLPREVLGAAKLTIELCQDLDRASARNIERLANTPLSQSREHLELVNAFMKDRK